MPCGVCSNKADVDWDNMGFGLKDVATVSAEDALACPCSASRFVATRHMPCCESCKPCTQATRATLQHVQTMYVAQWTLERGWDQGSLQPYGPLQILPSAQVLNYGQAVFEGLKAQHSEKGSIVLFRPDQNAARMHDGALRLSMPPVPQQQFVEAVKSVVRANTGFVSAATGTLLVLVLFRVDLRLRHLCLVLKKGHNI